MKKRPIVLAIAAVGLLGACSDTDASDVDLQEPKFTGDALPSDYSARAPDTITVYGNVDDHPTIVKLCIEGLAFRTLSTSHDGGWEGSAARVEEWDESCPAPEGGE